MASATQPTKHRASGIGGRRFTECIAVQLHYGVGADEDRRRVCRPRQRKLSNRGTGFCFRETEGHRDHRLARVAGLVNFGCKNVE
jgi:hypothetical protein